MKNFFRTVYNEIVYFERQILTLLFYVLKGFFVVIEHAFTLSKNIVRLSYEIHDLLYNLLATLGDLLFFVKKILLWITTFVSNRNQKTLYDVKILLVSTYKGSRILRFLFFFVKELCFGIADYNIARQ